MNLLHFRLSGILLALLTTLSLESPAQQWIARHGLTAAQYQQAFNDLGKQGLYPKMVTGYSLNNQANYSALWEKTNNTVREYRNGMNSVQYQQTFNTLQQQGYRLTYVQGFVVADIPYFNAIWEKSGGPVYEARNNLTGVQYEQLYNQYSKQGYQLTLVSGYTVNGVPNFACIWVKQPAPSWETRYNMTQQQYQDYFNQYTRQGYKLTCVTGYTNGGQANYAAIWEKQASTPLWYARNGIPLNFYQYVFDNFYFQGYTPEFLTGYNINNEVQFAGIWNNTSVSSADMTRMDDSINNFMNKNGVPGLCVAFCKNDRLVFAKGYGNAVQETGEPASPDQRFRIASVSKPMTSLGIMSLFAEGRLHLGDTVFGPHGILNEFTVPANNKMAGLITVSELLHHTSGFQENKGDPAFDNYQMSRTQVIQWELNNEILSTTPGTNYFYLNFGYILLASIIERVSKESYEPYMRDHVFSRCKVTNMVVGKNTLAERCPDEAEYYPSSAGNNPYGLDLTRMEGNGCWLASVLDLAEVLVHINGNHGVPDILPPAQMDSLTETTPASGNYGCGFLVWNNNAKGHNGAMSGTNALLHDAGDGGGWVVVMNTRAPNDGYAWGLDTTLGALYTAINWPNYNLFP